MPGTLGADDHVDIVHVRWSAGFEEVEARVSVFEGRLRVRGVQRVEWRDRLFGSFSEIGLPDPSTEPAAAVQQLHERYAGDYLYATSPHPRAQCPYKKRVRALNGAGLPVKTAAAAGQR